jgi:hypothetical protein
LTHNRKTIDQDERRRNRRDEMMIDRLVGFLAVETKNKLSCRLSAKKAQREGGY